MFLEIICEGDYTFLYAFYPNITLLHNIQQNKHENVATDFSKVNRHFSKMSRVTVTKNFLWF